MVLKALSCSILMLVFINVLISQGNTVGAIAFFGQQGLDVTAIRNLLPIRSGSRYPSDRSERDSWKQAVRDAVKKQTGQNATDVAVLRCERGGALTVYVGLPGASSHPISYSPVPSGTARLPAELLKLEDEIDEGIMKATLEGRGQEDDSAGYALLAGDPIVRKKQLEVRAFALKNEKQIIKVLDTAADAHHRSIAADALGYARQSQKQIDALVRASFDADGDVRNSSMRALGFCSARNRNSPNTFGRRALLNCSVREDGKTGIKQAACYGHSRRRAIQNFLKCCAKTRSRH